MISRIYLALNFAVIGLIAVAYLYDPNLLLSRYELETGSIGMDNMLRSTFGGVFLAVSALFLLGFINPDHRRNALGIAMLFFAGLALGRLMSIASAGLPPASIMMLLYYEIAAALIAMGLYLRSPQPE